jgi:hypothetical protein
MSSIDQLNANRENAQKSTGPVTPEGKLKSSLNATKHGFTGLSFQLTQPEIEPYQRYAANMTAELRPSTEQSRELALHYIDLRWSLNQILIQQTNLLSIIDQITNQILATGDITGLEKALESPYRRLRTPGIYEQRRRRAAADTLERFNQLEKDHRAQLELAAASQQAMKKLNQNWDPAEFGFVCSCAEIDAYIRVRDFRRNLLQAKSSASSHGM